MSDSDLVRRGDVLALIQRAREECETDLRQVRSWVEYLPADPVAAAAVALAEAFEQRLLGVTDHIVRTRVCMIIDADDAPEITTAFLAYREARRAAKGGGMADKTSIEWTDATWSPIAAFRRDNGKRGWHCEKVSAGCKGCYAERLNGRKLQVGTGLPYTRASRDLVEIRAVNLDVPLRWRTPRRIFVESMSDLFAEFVPDELIDQVFAVMWLEYIQRWDGRESSPEALPEAPHGCPAHIYQLLTKRPERACAYLRNHATAWRIGERVASRVGLPIRVPRSWWPLPNVHLGVSVEDQATADERIPLLLSTPAAVRFVSYEPALGPVEFSRWLHIRRDCAGACGPHDRERGLNQIIVGGESGPGARPFDVAWARNTISQCKAAGVACFVKQLGSKPYGAHMDDRRTPFKVYGDWKLHDRKGGDPSEWPEDLRVREFPEDRP